MSAVCARCGYVRAVLPDPCPGCGLVPEGEGLVVAWLLSDAHLGAAELERVAARIRGGEEVRPSERLLQRARRKLRRHFETDPGLSARERVGLLAADLLVSPLIGWVLWASWRTRRPRAAAQALALTAPLTVASFVAVVWFAWR